MTVQRRIRLAVLIALPVVAGLIQAGPLGAAGLGAVAHDVNARCGAVTGHAAQPRLLRRGIA